MKFAFSILALAAALPAFAEEARQLEAHEHGVGTLNIAVEGTTVAMEFEAPGADIVGFEYEATSDADLSAIDAAVATLSAPLDLFVMPDAAGCTVVKAFAEVESEDDHDEHEGEHHDDHTDDDHDEHGDEHHDEHADEGHDDEHHDEHADEAGHTEFHAKYELKCDNPDALTKITFAYFETFSNALEVELQIINASGAQAFEVERDSPILDLER